MATPPFFESAGGLLRSMEVIRVSFVRLLRSGRLETQQIGVTVGPDFAVIGTASSREPATTSMLHRPLCDDVITYSNVGFIRRYGPYNVGVIYIII